MYIKHYHKCFQTLARYTPFIQYPIKSRHLSVVYISKLVWQNKKSRQSLRTWQKNTFSKLSSKGQLPHMKIIS